MNWYSYCAGDPVMFVDPWGLFDYDDKLSYNQTYNEDVVALQERLVELGYMNAPADGEWGYFGPKTLSAVNQYKNDMGLWNFGEYEGVVGLTTWQSLGLIYRTQGDIDRGVSISLVGRKQYFDVTKMFNDQLWYAEQYLKNLFPIGQVQYEWLKKVNHEGDWDIKLRKSWDKTFGGSYPGSPTSQVVLYGELSTHEQMGNIMYGYTGRCIGLADIVLYSGSFFAAPQQNIQNLGAELSDWGSIATGINLYDSKHPMTMLFIL